MKDGSLVGKWRKGFVKRITSLDHLRELPRLLDTPDDYWEPRPEQDLLEELEVEVDQLTVALEDARRYGSWLLLRIQELEAHLGYKPRPGLAKPPTPLERIGP